MQDETKIANRISFVWMVIQLSVIYIKPGISLPFEMVYSTADCLQNRGCFVVALTTEWVGSILICCCLHPMFVQKFRITIITSIATMKSLYELYIIKQ